jgi:hypothetical protein
MWRRARPRVRAHTLVIGIGIGIGIGAGASYRRAEKNGLAELNGRGAHYLVRCRCR